MTIREERVNAFFSLIYPSQIELYSAFMQGVGSVAHQPTIQVYSKLLEDAIASRANGNCLSRSRVMQQGVEGKKLPEAVTDLLVTRMAGKEIYAGRHCMHACYCVGML